MSVHISKLKRAPQELPPVGGFFIPKFRMTTLNAKGFTTPQIYLTYGLFLISGWALLYRHAEEANAQNYINITATSMQSNVLTLMHGPIVEVEANIHPLRTPLSFLGNPDYRTRAFVNAVALHESHEIVDKYRKQQGFSKADQ